MYQLLARRVRERDEEFLNVKGHLSFYKQYNLMQAIADRVLIQLEAD